MVEYSKSEHETRNGLIALTTLTILSVFSAGYLMKGLDYLNLSKEEAKNNAKIFCKEYKQSNFLEKTLLFGSYIRSKKEIKK